MVVQQPTGAIECMYSLAGDCIDAPSAETVARQLERLTHAEPGASITLCAGARSMRIKFLPGRGYYVLTFREDFSVDTMFLAPENELLQTVSSFGS